MRCPNCGNELSSAGCTTCQLLVHFPTSTTISIGPFLDDDFPTTDADRLLCVLRAENEVLRQRAEAAEARVVRLADVLAIVAFRFNRGEWCWCVRPLSDPMSGGKHTHECLDARAALKGNQ